MINKKNILRVLKFCTIGSIGIATNYGFIYLFAFMANTNIKNILVIVIAGIVNTTLNYLANHYWTFRDRKYGKNISIGGIKFFIVTALSIGIYALLVWGFNKTGLDPRLSVLIANIISFAPRYLMCYFWVWRENVSRMPIVQKEI